VRMVARGRVSYTTSTRFRIAKKGGGGVRVGGVSARNRRSATFRSMTITDVHWDA
jgi:hypothetical protein